MAGCVTRLVQPRPVGGWRPGRNSVFQPLKLKHNCRGQADFELPGGTNQPVPFASQIKTGRLLKGDYAFAAEMALPALQIFVVHSLGFGLGISRRHAQDLKRLIRRRLEPVSCPSGMKRPSNGPISNTSSSVLP